MKQLGMIALFMSSVLAVPTYAASLSFVYAGNNAVDANGNPYASVNDLLTFDLVMDFTDSPTIGGTFDIAFDATVLDFVSYTLADFGDPSFSRAPDELPNRLEGGAFGSFDGLSGPAVFAQLSFTVIDSRATDIAFTESIGLDPAFISVDYVTLIDVDYGSILVRTPLPAAAWLLLSACGVLGFATRRRHDSGDASSNI